MTEKINMISKKDCEFEDVGALGFEPSQKFLFYQLLKRGFDPDIAKRICRNANCETFSELLEVLE